MLRDRQKDLLNFCRRRNILLQRDKTGRHYLLATDGEHSDELFQFAIGFQDADFRRIIATEFMEDFGSLGLLSQYDGENKIGVIVTPALGGILLAGTLQHLFYGEKPILLYAEKKHGKHYFGRNFKLPADKGILLLDDVRSTGGSINDLMRLCMEEKDAGPIVAIAAIVNRNVQGLPRVNDMISIPHIYLLSYPIPSFSPLLCLSCKEGVPLDKDGVLVDVHGNPIWQSEVKESTDNP